MVVAIRFFQSETVVSYDLSSASPGSSLDKLSTHPTTTTTTTASIMRTTPAAPATTTMTMSDYSDRFECVRIPDTLIPMLSSNRTHTAATTTAAAAATKEPKPRLYAYASAKAGGSSLTTFVNNCAGCKEHLCNGITEEQRRNQRLFGGHVLSDLPLLRTMRFASSVGNPLVYSFRPEPDRLSSAISHVLRGRVCHEGDRQDECPFLGLAKKNVTRRTDEASGTETCTIHEQAFVDHVIQERCIEVGTSTYLTLTCKVWEAVDMYRPNFFIVDYQRLDEFQRVVSGPLCPHVQSIRTNTALADDRSKYFVQTAKDGTLPLNEWIQRRKHKFEWWAGNPDGGCKDITIGLAEALKTCPYGMVRVKPRTQQAFATQYHQHQ